MFAILIPAYEPDETLVEVVRALRAKGLDENTPLIVVNDGSTQAQCAHVFQQLVQLGVELIQHDVNQGKGAALKSGISAIREHYPDVLFVVTADADGQHAAEDIISVANTAISAGAPVLGVREFDGDVPVRSRIGNNATKVLFRVFSGASVKDTQTGLRAYSREDFADLLSISENRYEFEFDALFKLCRKWRSKLIQVPIKTIYEPGNPTSHFDPLRDSMKIYAVFFRYTSVAFVISFLDILIFQITLLLGMEILTGLLVARLMTAALYFSMMKDVVFRAKQATAWRSIIVSFIMVVHVFALSGTIAWLVETTGLPTMFAMVVGSVGFFVVVFAIQRYGVFRLRTEIR